MVTMMSSVDQMLYVNGQQPPPQQSMLPVQTGTLPMPTEANANDDTNANDDMDLRNVFEVFDGGLISDDDSVNNDEDITMADDFSSSSSIIPLDYRLDWSEDIIMEVDVVECLEQRFLLREEEGIVDLCSISPVLNAPQPVSPTTAVLSQYDLQAVQTSAKFRALLARRSHTVPNMVSMD